jgi:hypothetical protein
VCDLHNRGAAVDDVRLTSASTCADVIDNRYGWIGPAITLGDGALVSQTQVAAATVPLRARWARRIR